MDVPDSYGPIEALQQRWTSLCSAYHIPEQDLQHMSQWSSPTLAMPRPSLAKVHPCFAHVVINCSLHSLNLNFQKTIQLVEQWWQRIFEQYNGSGRKYHGLKHLVQLFQMFDEHRNELTETSIVCFALFFHDIYYDSTLATNEERSAGLFQAFVDDALGKLPENLVTQVKSWILLTKYHGSNVHEQQGKSIEQCDAAVASSVEHDKCFFLDFDLSVLGLDETDYDVYAKQIRLEYSHVPTHTYCINRMQVLQQFLSLPHIYRTAAFREYYEAPARANIQNEIHQLEEKLTEMRMLFEEDTY